MDVILINMRKIVLFIAMSLDGYIADCNGAVDWMHEQGDAGNDIYAEFIKTVDTVIMGWNTYYQISAVLSPTQWVYGDLTSYVITHRELPSTDTIIFTAKNPWDIVHELKQRNGKDIWICGGANIAQQIIGHDLIDTYHISIMPTILGAGIRLFGEIPAAMELQLIQTKRYNGITDLIYTPR